jgi:hypothetical protein
MNDLRREEPPEPPCRLTFLLYRARSGSTFFGDRLSRHPEILVIPESNVAPRLQFYFKSRQNTETNIEELVEFIYAEQKFKDWGLPASELAKTLHLLPHPDWGSVFKACLVSYAAWKKPEAKVVVFKKGGWYVTNFNALLNFFPEANFIWMLRDPRGVYNSARKALHSEKKTPLGGHVVKDALAWNSFNRALNRALSHWPRKTLIFRYEKFISNPALVLRRVFAFLGVAQLSAAALESLLGGTQHSHLVSPSTSHLHTNITKPPLPDRVQGWEKELNRLEKITLTVLCRRGMWQHGYL